MYNKIYEATEHLLRYLIFKIYILVLKYFNLKIYNLPICYMSRMHYAISSWKDAISICSFIYSKVSALHMLIKLRIWKDASGCCGRASDFNASDKIKRMRLNVERAGKSHLHSQKYSTDKRVIPMRKHARPVRLKFAVPYRSLRVSIDYKRTSGSHFTICIENRRISVKTVLHVDHNRPRDFKRDCIRIKNMTNWDTRKKYDVWNMCEKIMVRSMIIIL